MNELTSMQKKCIKTIVERLEKEDAKESVRLRPVDLLPLYESAFCDVEEKEQFEQDIAELESAGLVRTTKKKNGIKTIIGGRESADYYYASLNTEALEERRKRVLDHLEAINGSCKVAKEYLEEERSKVKNPESVDLHRIRDHVVILDFLYTGHEDILERELSQKLFHYTKKIEKMYRTSVTKVILRHDPELSDMTDTDMSEDELNILVWGAFGVYRLPNYIYIQGNGEIELQDGRTRPIYPDFPSSISSKELPFIKTVRLHGTDTLLTVENLAAFDRMPCEGRVKIFLGGYHNHNKQEFLKMIAETNPNIKSWMHSGDLDPDGFMILTTLRKGTGLPFVPFMMDAGILEKYIQFGIPLKSNGRKKAEKLLQEPEFAEMARLMLRSGKILEQEIVVYEEVSSGTQVI